MKTQCLFLLLFASGLAWAADPVEEIVNAREEFFDQAPVAVPTPEPEDLESFLLSRRPESTLVLIQQVEGTGNRADVSQQSGGRDIAVVLQGFGDGNQATVNQVGNGNLAVISQSGSGNTVVPIEQLGDDNIARLTQFGSNNSARVSQFNEANELTLRQTDSFNEADIIQNGNTGLAITQTNPDGTQAAVNSLSVTTTVEPGFVSNITNIDLVGPGTAVYNLCSGSPGFCSP